MQRRELSRLTRQPSSLLTISYLPPSRWRNSIAARRRRRRRRATAIVIRESRICRARRRLRGSSSRLTRSQRFAEAARRRRGAAPRPRRETPATANSCPRRLAGRRIRVITARENGAGARPRARVYPLPKMSGMRDCISCTVYRGFQNAMNTRARGAVGRHSDRE